MRFTRDYSAEIDHLKKEIQTADAIVIGAGAGLSTAAGFTYSGERLQRTGHATFTSTAIWTWTTAHTSACLSL